MAKGIRTKGVCFNENSKYHMEVLDWVESQSENFSGFVFTILSSYYEQSKNLQHKCSEIPTPKINKSKILEVLA